MRFASLYFIFAYFGLICINGGGSLMQFFVDDLVNSRHWMTLEELGNFMAISQVTPGPIGINIATFLGYMQGGIPGSILCTVGLLTPSFFLMSLAVSSYSRWKHTNVVHSLMYGIRPMTVSLVLSALSAHIGMSILTRPIPFDVLVNWEWSRLRGIAVRFELIPIFIFALWALRKKKLSITSVIFACAFLGILLHCGRVLIFG